jgi:hypothetical protein
VAIHHRLKRLLERSEIQFSAQRVPLLIQVHAGLRSVEDVKEYALLKRR